MIVLQDGILVTQRGRIAKLASMVRLPDIHSVRDAVLVGGFLSYRISLRESFRRAAGLAKPLLSLPSFREAASPKKCRLINPPNFNS
jgi:hypothetical protein